MATRIRIRRLEPREPLSLNELARYSGLRSQRLLDMVSAGILEPLESSRGEWRFAQEAIQRVRISVRLQRDLGVNLAGAALALDLLQEVRRLRALAGGEFVDSE